MQANWKRSVVVAVLAVGWSGWAWGQAGTGGCGQGGGGGCCRAGGGGEGKTAGQTAGALSAGDLAGVLRMREEETLAREVYLALQEKTGLPMFTPIAAAEQRHINAVGGLIDAFGLEDPLAGRTPGAYRDPELQALHDELIRTGSASLEAALRVGARVEELDIADLQRLIEQTEQPNLLTVYGNLQRASRNHLRAFAGQLAARGHTYRSQHLAQAEFDAIAQGNHEAGGCGNCGSCNPAAGEAESGSSLRPGHGPGHGMGPGMGQGMGPGKGPGMGRGMGRNRPSAP